MRARLDRPKLYLLAVAREQPRLARRPRLWVEAEGLRLEDLEPAAANMLALLHREEHRERLPPARAD